MINGTALPRKNDSVIVILIVNRSPPIIGDFQSFYGNILTFCS